MQLTWEPPVITTSTAQMSWGVDYAAEVHEGATFVGGFSTEGRPFTTAALSQFDVAESMAERYRSSQNLSQSFVSSVETFGDVVRQTIDDYDWGDGGRSSKVYRNAPTWKTITDSGALRDSQRIDFL